jgi:flavin-dependent dehydrogenase
VTRTAEALVIGGGPAGAAAAILLARGGREVALIEKTARAHDKVCGEFLSGEAVHYLSELGVDLRALGALPVNGVRLVRKKAIAECDLPFAAVSVTRRKLDEVLLELAVHEGVDLRRGHRVDVLHRQTEVWAAQLADGKVLRARQLFLATGKHDLGGWHRPPGRQNDLVAFKMYFALSSAQQFALRGWIELCLFPGGYAGLQLAEDGSANLCLLVNRRTLHACGNDWQKLLEHMVNFSDHLAERLEGARALLQRSLALSSIPYGMLLRSTEPGLWRLGDQVAVTPSFSGDGMSIALHSAEIAARLYCKGASSAEFAARMHHELWKPVALATTVSQLMIAAPVLAPIMKLWPPLLRVLAQGTRVPQAALVS